MVPKNSRNSSPVGTEKAGRANNNRDREIREMVPKNRAREIREKAGQTSRPGDRGEADRAKKRVPQPPESVETPALRTAGARWRRRWRRRLKGGTGVRVALWALARGRGC